MNNRLYFEFHFKLIDVNQYLNISERFPLIISDMLCYQREESKII